MPELLGPDVTSRPPRHFKPSAPSLQRDRMLARMHEHPLAGISRGEVEMHFRGMPARYWERVTKAELTWGLETVHAFLERQAGAEGMRVAVVASSRHYPARGFSKIMVCAQDRPGLLAKIAAAFSALRVNVLRADVFTRSDGVALDVFEVADLEQSHLTGADRLRQLVFLLEGALSEPPRFASVWASEFHKMAPRGPQGPPRVEFDNEYSSEHTVVRVEATDRLGLLHDLLKALAECSLNIDEALVETTDHLATDSFYVTNLRGEKLLEPEQLRELRRALVEAVTG
jgi:[protein-PII] uridylyltransferase